MANRILGYLKKLSPVLYYSFSRIWYSFIPVTPIKYRKTIQLKEFYTPLFYLFGDYLQTFSLPEAGRRHGTKLPQGPWWNWVRVTMSPCHHGIESSRPKAAVMQWRPVFDGFLMSVVVMIFTILYPWATHEKFHLTSWEVIEFSFSVPKTMFLKRQKVPLKKCLGWHMILAARLFWWLNPWISVIIHHYADSFYIKCSLWKKYIYMKVCIYIYTNPHLWPGFFKNRKMKQSALW